MSTQLQAKVTSADIWEDSGATCQARIIGQAGVNITQASLSSITCKVFDLNGTTPDTPVATPTVTISSSVFDALQTDATWSTDDTGYNFSHTLAASIFTTGDHRYRVEYTFTPVTGEAFPVVFELMAQNLRGS